MATNLQKMQLVSVFHLVETFLHHRWSLCLSPHNSLIRIFAYDGGYNLSSDEYDRRKGWIALI